MLNNIVLVLSLFGVFQSGLGRILQSGQCDPDIELVTNFNYSEFLGSWYEIATTDPENGDCSEYQFGTEAPYNVSRSAVNKNFEELQNGLLVVTDSPRLVINWTDSETIADFWVMMHVSGSFALIYNCQNVSPLERSVSVLLLQRSTESLPAMTLLPINNTLNNIGLSLEDLENVLRDDYACTVLPVITPGTPVVLPGQCENIDIVQNFDVFAFTGLWHEIESYYSENSENQCSRARYTLNGDVVDVLNSQVINRELDTISGTARVVSNDGSARLEVILNVAGNLTVGQELLVLATDYTNYAISYTCINVTTDTKRVFSWILSRTRELSETARAAVNAVIDSELVLNSRYYQPTNQTDDSCFYYPEPVPNQPVVTGGFCNQDIPVVSNFDAINYMGTWHDIESYPSVFQTGTCRNANYDLADVVNVLNTQVINQTLDTTIGFAVPSSNDGSAKLDVTFPIAGTEATVTSNYWVLSTDYVTYALVYSCVNLVETENRQVWAWKISRTKQLTTDAINAINNVMANYPELDQRYFQTVDQSPDACFYFPEPQPGVVVRFPGQCEENIPVVQNFNMTLFSGTWYEIEAYPKLQQQGQCIAHDYSVEGNTLNVESRQIEDQFLSTFSSTMSFNSTDDSAKMTITLSNLGIEIPFWILDVDYEDYALAYSCVNLDDDFRAVYSWKLSRTNQLSTNAISSINDQIASVDVLRQEYYETIDQSNEACFYLPDLAPGEPVILVGQCDPDIPVVENFNASGYLGQWRLIESYPSDFQNGTCNRATYTLNGDGSVDVFNTQVNNETLVTINGVATVLESGKLEVTFPNAPPLEYWVLDTDYDSYSLVYSCQNIAENQRRVWSWKLSRTASLTPQAVEAINAKIATVEVLNNRYYEQIDHSEEACFYFPDPDRSTTVRLRGQCDQTIPTVPDFNVTAYLGLWHNIELYPSTFQAGTCSNAWYEAGTEGVIVFNTQVVDQTLDTMTGLAVVASTDGSAKLDVTFPVAGTNFTVTTNYWVLDTDYETYSLVYTCMPDNEDDEYVQVFSWKLSRTKQLTPTAQAAMNTVINNVKFLDDRYYFDGDQTPEGCFYYPEPEPGKPVVLPGQCDTNITVVSNFDLSQFEGVWYEIEAYPKEQQQGECINHEYTSGAPNTLNLQSSHVYDQSLFINNGVLSFDTTDNSARMSINISVDGEDITIPFWILATDYTDYALAYSCVNLDNDHRGVYSWKLSRTNQLSTNAISSINDQIASVDVLRQEYYETIDQSNEACFYLPDLAPGEPVILVGQCDPDIPVVENFNASGYLGQWRLIESYPSDFQNGTCNRATYTLNGDGSVDVFNTQVNNETLVTINGVATVLESGKLEVTFPNAPPLEYWVLDTDYDSYSLVYSCQNISENQRRVWSWKLSRTASLTPQAVEAINAKIATVEVLNNRYYEQIDHSEEACFYFPDPDRSTTVRLRGQCDQTIPTVPDFNVTAYLGLWHNIELYPSTFQAGTCSNAWYEAGTEGVIVFNTQVVDQTLDTMTGLAVVASTDGSAKLDVTFPVAGTNFTVTTNYWVLDTDYETYSLVYTCMPDNEDDEYVQVFSWKLSRTKQLTPTAQAAMNTVINNVKFLDDRYYFDGDQTPEGCFYYPEPEPGKPVVFPGQCDTNITVVSNFDLSQFEGVWYEIEAYPKEQQQGECINHEYTSGAPNTLNLQSSHVYDQSLFINNGVLSFDTTDNSARMSINISVDGEDITIPFWILATDYTDYALAYSCVNLDNDHRGVYSWKLSRSRTLTNETTNSIDAILSNSGIDVLHQRYYENIDQSDEACFYLPNLGPGEPAIFPGQCDDTIPTVANFNATAYLGRWRTIATYASDFQGGNCGQATYSPADVDNTVIVYNTQVMGNQTLDEIYGTAELIDDGKLLVNFSTAPVLSNYWVLATDYESYSLVYSCRNLDDNRRQVWSWKLSRERELSDDANNAINAVINNVNVLNERYYESVEQTEEACFYYPEADGQPLRFRGQCNDSISVLTNFDPAQYAGTWYDIESYPQGFQFGTCPTANYMLNGDVVDVYNTQVFDRELDVINATAVLATDDGSAKLIVTFPIAGTDAFIDTSYWILDTDYSNYSLVYSCQNIDEEYYQVTSWKLSRSQELSPESSAAISQTMANVKELRQQYFVEQKHSDEDCFTYPDNFGGPVILDGQCDNDEDINVIENFNAASFSGNWFEVSHYPSDLQAGECVSNNYNFDQNPTVTMSVVVNEALITYSGPVTLTESATRGIFSVDLSNENDEKIEGKLYILATDYDEYALMYSCVPISNDQKQIFSWKLSRSRQGLSANAEAAINDIVRSTDDLAPKYYEETRQDDDACFYYPQFEGVPTAIILPGSCDTNIGGVPNFNAEAYLGRWYEIQKYPQADQFGECSQATYTSGANAVDVVNTQVDNRTLLTQEGTAVLGSTDNTGQLIVTFVVGGETRTANYYILDTDYASYSLVHSCRNLEDNRRQVFSWKLSRMPTLSDAANAAISNTIDNTQELLQRYYLDTSQSDEDCFYVPEFNPDEPVHFRGRCAQLSSGITNFDSQRYLDQWWHEIERYPSGTDGGQCVSTRYEQSNGQVSFTDTRVFDNEGSITTGTVTAQANGQIVKTFSDGTSEQLWVLATDYDTYSLLLSCEDVDDEYMRVWSAKHSRNRTLSADAQNGMAPIIAENNVLYEEFFLPVAQTDSACFYYPPVTGQQVILPGQCDSSIPTMQNFELVDYTGTWYQTERYPYPEIADDSECIGTRYTLRGNEVDVRNWENVDGEVVAIEGTATWTEGTATLTVVLQTGEDTTSTTELHVLSTDYTTYSLVYTCSNVDAFHRAVVAIKLSRTRAMPAEATTAINAYMATREELNQMYFIQVEQNEDCTDSSFMFKSSIVITFICVLINKIL